MRAVTVSRYKPTCIVRLRGENLERREMLAAVFYDDALQSPWQNWSWGTTVDYENTSPVHLGSHSIAAQHNEAWAGLYFGSNEGISAVGMKEIQFSIHGGVGGQQVRFVVVDGNGDWIDGVNVTPTASQWTDVVVELDQLGSPSQIRGLVWQDASGSSQNRFFLDEVTLIAGELGSPENGPTIVVDPTVSIRQISDQIYGMNFADETLANDINLPVNRWGGNSTSRFNYQNDATNLASDWYFENYPNETPNVSSLPANSTADVFVRDNAARSTESIMTVGMLGWVPNSREIQGSFPVDQFGAQQSVDPWRPQYGNGVRPDGTLVTGNDPAATSDRVDESFAADWVTHLVQQHGNAANGGVQFYALDNEPMLWNSTHRDVHPEPASYDEVLTTGIDYATAIKQVDPLAQVLGPTVWGWSAYFYSALDSAAGGAWWQDPVDRNAHGGLPFIPWYLQEMATADANTGTRLLDYLDIHYYPQNTNVALSGAGDLATQQARLESTRSLWDPTYVDKSWINETVQLIPRMRDWIDTYYPDTKLAITEYNWGGVEHISGALAQADVLGIFGREGVDLATMWSPPDANDPAGFSFRMYRNYDGKGGAGSMFGETSLQASSSDLSAVSVYAARRSADDALTVVLVNKSQSPLDTPVQFAALDQFDGPSNQIAAEVYTYDVSNLGQIVRGQDALFVDGSTMLRLPANSITLLELPMVAAQVEGDFDQDGIITVADIDLLSVAIRGDGWNLTFDLNGDLSVDAADGDWMIRKVVGTLYGDANLNQVVDALDYDLWQTHRFTNADSWGAGDFNWDGVVDVSDFNIWHDNRFTVAASTIDFDIDRSEVPTIVDLPRARELRAAGHSLGGHGWDSGCDHTSTENAQRSLDHLQAHFSDYQIISFAAANRKWYNTLAHSGHENDAAEILDYLMTFDDVWMAPSDEVYSYLLVRELTDIANPRSSPPRPAGISK